MKKKISIIVVTYNAAATLAKCLQSIFSQTYPLIELIVIDGKSTDSTLQILETHSNNITYWCSETDTGVYDAMNKALEHTSGDYIYFLGADDELLPAFSEMVNELADPFVIYYANVFSDGGIRLGKRSRYQQAKAGIFHQAIIYPKAVFAKYRYNLKYQISADFALTLQLCGDKGFRFVYKDYVIANFNHTGLSGTFVDTPFQNDKPAMILKSFGLVTWLRYQLHKIKNRHNPRA